VTVAQHDAQRVIAATERWLERAVIGLGLCPFAERVHRRKLIRYRVSAQVSTAGLLDELGEELLHLRATDPQLCETTLLIHPWVLGDFAEYNQFLDEADATLLALGLSDELQIASFHPHYRFAGTGPDDVDNYTNRSPHPMLHLLRQASVTRAVTAFPAATEIGARNAATLRALGLAGWRALWSDAESVMEPHAIPGGPCNDALEDQPHTPPGVRS
jgi:hypothetical protein